jgi:hypothetical protein
MTDLERVTKLAEELGATQGFLGGEPAHVTNMTWTFLKPELLAFEQAVLAKQSAEIEQLRHENHNLNWTLGTDGYGKMYTPEEQAEADKAHADTLERIEAMSKRNTVIESLQAKLDALMLEYCPDEMTKEQIETWKLAQRKYREV